MDDNTICVVFCNCNVAKQLVDQDPEWKKVIECA